MIRRLSFSNFCSFREETDIDFTASAKLRENGAYAASGRGDRVSLLAGVFGPNAAGKTNLLKALAFVSFFLRDSYRHLEPGESIPLDRFAGSETENLASAFEIEFEGPAGRFLYAVRVTPDEVGEETLKRFSGKTRQFRQVLSRKLNRDGTLRLRSFDDFTEISLVREVLQNRPNASILAAGMQTGRKEFRGVLDSLGPVVTNVTRAGKREQPFEGLTTDVFRRSEFFHKHPEHHEALRELLRAADIGITDFDIRPIRLTTESGEARESFLIHFRHEGPAGSFDLGADRESSGTRRLFMLFEAFVKILDSGGIAVIDEMESDLHPHLIPTIFGLFTDREINAKQAQLFFTCHHVEMLNHLLKEQIFLVEKNDSSMSEAYRLDNLKGVRREENFVANYNSGRYGAIPEPEVVAF